jgi:hypothetical protein
VHEWTLLKSYITGSATMSTPGLYDVIAKTNYLIVYNPFRHYKRSALLAAALTGQGGTRPHHLAPVSHDVGSLQI